MSYRRRFGRRRSGIANLVGAVFFILVVALVISTLSAIFVASSGYVQAIHTAAQQAQSESNSQVAVTDAAFGGQVGRPGSTAQISVNNTSTATPLLPITNMNFTDGMAHWFSSESYPSLTDSGQVQNGLLANGSSYIEQSTLTTTQSSNIVTFELAVTNNDGLGTGIDIAKVSLLVDTYFESPAWGSCATPATCSGWALDPAVGNNLTLVAPIGAALVPGDTAALTWTAEVPDASGVYYTTAVVSWYDALSGAFVDQGIATVNTTITSPLPLPNPTAPMVPISPRTANVVPGGLVAGYNPNSVGTGSSSGPGSVYVDFQPTFSGQPVPSGQQLSGSAVLSYGFSLTSSQVGQLDVGAPMGASWESSLEDASSTPNSLLYYHVVLVNPAGSAYLVNPGGTDPTTLNHFSPTGWIQTSMQLQPSPAFWVAGEYQFEVIANMTVPGGQTSDILMNFDDVGLALNLVQTPGAGSAYGDETVTIPFSGVSTAQVQDLSLSLNMSLSDSASVQLPNTVAYVYVQDSTVDLLNQPVFTKWLEVAAVPFNSSEDAQLTIPLSDPANYIVTSGSSGDLSFRVVVVSVGNGATCNIPAAPPYCTLTVSSYAVVQTGSTSDVVFTVTGAQGQQPIQLVALYFAGPNGTLPSNGAVGNANGVASFTLDNYVSVGHTLVIYEDLSTLNFAWIPGQVYQVTVVTSTGVGYSASFTAP